MDKDFSIIFPTRDRPKLLIGLLDSIAQTAKNLDRIEVLIAIDDDDKDMQAFWASRVCPFAKAFSVERSLNFSRDYYNFLLGKSSGRWVIACNDDAEFVTQDWDQAAKDRILTFLKDRPNIVYGWIEDHLGSHRLTQFGNYCCFPLLGRTGIEALGYFFPERIPTWGADIWVEQLYKNIGRVVELPMTIKHISIHNGLRKPDAIYQRIATNQVATNMSPTYIELNKLIAAASLKKEAYA